MKFILAFLMVVVSTSATLGGETDQYLTLGKSPASAGKGAKASAFVSKYINDQIGLHLKEINSRIGKSALPFRYKQYAGMSRCEGVAFRLIKRMGSTWYGAALNAKIEVWADRAGNRVSVFPNRARVSNSNYIKASIYGPRINAVSRAFVAIDRSINVDGVWFGTDKLSHFTSSGYLYYQNYLRDRARLGDHKAKLRMIRKGITTEYTVLGLGTTQVFSYADLEANYQGFRMAMDFCRKRSPILKEKNGKWVMNRKVRIADYVNPNWDEVYYQSTYTKAMRSKVAKNLKRLGYCSAKGRAKVKKRRSRYSRRRDSRDSFSVKAIKRFEKQKQAPVQSAFTFEKLCGSK